MGTTDLVVVGRVTKRQCAKLRSPLHWTRRLVRQKKATRLGKRKHEIGEEVTNPRQHFRMNSYHEHIARRTDETQVSYMPLFLPIRDPRRRSYER